MILLHFCFQNKRVKWAKIESFKCWSPNSFLLLLPSPPTQEFTPSTCATPQSVCAEKPGFPSSGAAQLPYSPLLQAPASR